MILYGLPYSAYCVKVRIALRLKGCAFEEVPPPDGYRSDAYRAIVGTGTIPALVTGDALLVYRDAESDRMNVMHRDSDGNFQLVDPEFDTMKRGLFIGCRFELLTEGRMNGSKAMVFRDCTFGDLLPVNYDRAEQQRSLDDLFPGSEDD